MNLEETNSVQRSDLLKYTMPKQFIDQKNDIPVSDLRCYSEYYVEFVTQSRVYAVGMVDMVNSSKISAQIGSLKSAKYYQIFLNSMSKIIYQYGGIVIKNIGDCLFYYFPDSNKKDLINIITCSLEMTRSQKSISKQLISDGLPGIDLRVSADYGTVLLMKTSISERYDIFGLPVNMCSKINRLAEKNRFVIGSDLFQVVKEFKDYQFKEITDFSLGFKQSYPVYSVFEKFYQ